MTVLCTGYEPFGGDDENPSAAVARSLDGRTVGGHEVVGRVLPVAFDEVRPRLADLIDAHDPAAVVGTGVAAGRAGVAVERVGLNVDDAVTTPDNAGADPEAAPVEPGGPDARLATLPLAASVAALLDAGIPARVSNTAGTHSCNHHLNATQRRQEARGLREGPDRVPAGFVHLPLTPEMAAETARESEATRGGGVQPSLPLDLQVEAVETAAATALSELPDDA